MKPKDPNDKRIASEQIEKIIEMLSKSTTTTETITQEDINEALGFMTILHMQLNDPKRLKKAIQLKETQNVNQN